MKVSFDWKGPFECRFCPCSYWHEDRIYEDYTYECQMENKFVPGDTRPDWCPLEEVYS